MQVRSIQLGELIGAQRGEVVVCIPVYGGYERFVDCLESVLAHTPAGLRILVCDDASPDLRLRQHVYQRARESTVSLQLLYMRRQLNVGFPANVNAAFASSAPADVVLLNSDCLVAEGWLEGLREAAYANCATATATALTNHGTIVSVPERDVPCPTLPDSWSFDDAAAAVRSQSLRLRPRLPTAIGHCIYVRRSALELVGEFDLAFSPGYGEEVDFSQRCLHVGLCHVAADEVLVFHHGGGSFARDGRPDPVQAEHERILASRYPYYHDAVRASQRDLTGPLARALGAARRALTGLSVVIDARTIGDQIAEDRSLALISALARTGAARVTAIVPVALDQPTRQLLGRLDGVELLPVAPGAQAPSIGTADVVHRPTRFESEEEVWFAAELGDRLIISHGDLADFHDPSSFPSFGAWDRHRRVTRMTLLAADRVIFPSAHARDDALAEELVDPGRATVAPLGLDPAAASGDVEPRAPRAAERLPADGELMLLIASDRRQQNRVFALRVLEQLQRRHDWRGWLILCGPRVADGSSAAQEAQLLAASPRLAQAVLELAQASDAERSWMLRRASLVLCPPVRGGSGLIAFEAAAHGVPCLFSAGSWLGELVPDETGIVAWDAALAAERAHSLMRDRDARVRNVSALRGAGARLTWESAGARLLEIYNAACDAPPNPRRARPALDGLAHQPSDAEVPLSEDALRLVGPGGALPTDLERPLLALASHPRLGGPLFRALRKSYRASHWLVRWRADVKR